MQPHGIRREVAFRCGCSLRNRVVADLWRRPADCVDADVPTADNHALVVLISKQTFEVRVLYERVCEHKNERTNTKRSHLFIRRDHDVTVSIRLLQAEDYLLPLGTIRRTFGETTTVSELFMVSSHHR